MGAKAWFVAYFDSDPKAVLAGRPQLDPNASRALAERLFPKTGLVQIDDGSLSDLCPRKRHLHVGSFGDLRIVAHQELSSKDKVSQIDRRWFDPSLGRTAYVHATHSVVDWFAFGLWRDGKLVRSLSVTSENGVIEQLGEPLAFEAPYWAGQHSIEDESYPLPFHPLDLSEASLLEHLGFQFEGRREDWVCDPDSIALAHYTVKRPFWQFW